MTDIDQLIAQGPGRRDFSPLGEMFGAWRQGMQAKREDELAAARRGLGAMVGPDGQPDYGAAALHLLHAGDVNGAIALAHVARATIARNGAQAAPELPRLTTRGEVEDALREARAAREAGKDPLLVLKRLHELGINVSNY